MNRFLRVALPALVAAGTALATALPAQAADSFSVNDTAMLSNGDLTATVTGKIECPDGDQYNIAVSLRQGTTTVGSNTLVPLAQFVSCDGTPQSFQIPVIAQGPPIIGGLWRVDQANASVTATRVGDSGTRADEILKTIELTR